MWGTILKYVVPSLIGLAGPLVQMLDKDAKEKLDNIKAVCDKVKSGELEAKVAIDLIAEMLA